MKVRKKSKIKSLFLSSEDLQFMSTQKVLFHTIYKNHIQCNIYFLLISKGDKICMQVLTGHLLIIIESYYD